MSIRQKRSKGSGSVVVRKRKDRTAAYMLKYKTYTRTVPVASLTEAKELLRAFIVEVDSGQVDAKRALIKERIAEPTLEQWSKVFLAEHVTQDEDRVATVTAYEKAMRLYILPALGTYKLHEIEGQMVRQALQGLNKRGLSIATIQLTYAVLRRSLDAAIEDGVLKTANPVPRFAKLHLAAAKSDAEAVKNKALSQAQVRALISSCKAPDLRLWLAIMASGGLRPGEALGLRWRDIDFAAGVVSVSGSAKLDRKTGRRWIGKTKNKSSVRQVQVGAGLVGMLKDELERQEAYQRQLRGHGEGVQGIRKLVKGDYCVFPDDPSSADGVLLPVSMDSMRRRLYTVAKHAGLKTHPHALRHTHISHAIEGGLSLADAAKRAGHSSVLTTANTYVHVVSESQHKAAAIGDDLIAPAEQAPNVTPIHK